MYVKLVLLSLCFLESTQKASGRKMNLNVELFALPEHFQETSSNLNKQLSGDLKFFLKKMEMFLTKDLEIVDYTLTILNKKDINYPYWSSPLDADKIFKAMKESRKFQKSKANLKVLLIPSDTELKSEGDSAAGVATPVYGDFLDRMKQYAVVEIYTFESFVRGSIPKKNGEYTISVPDDWSGRINPHYLFGDGLKDQFKYMEKYGKKGGYYLYKLAEDVWAKRDDKFKINNLGVLAHEIGHLLGASECPEKHIYGLDFDGTNVMCSSGGSRVSEFSRSEIDCRVKNGYMRNGRCQTTNDYGSRRG